MSTLYEKSAPKPPARRVPIKSYEGIRGVTPDGQEFESLLENDYLTLLRFDPDVAQYRTQPFSISYRYEGRDARYTPDMFIEYRSTNPSFKARPHEIIEVKPKWIVAKADPLMIAKHAAAQEYAASSGWVFRVVTEDDIPADTLSNARFLLRYLSREPMEPYASLLLTSLQRFEQSRVGLILRLCQENEQNQAQLLTELWTLIAQRRIGADLETELTMNSTIWHVETP